MCADAAREFAYPAGHKKEATYGFLLLVNLPLSLRGHGENRRDETAPKRGTAEDFFSATDELPSESVLLSNLFAVSDTILLHMWFHLRKRDITVSRNSLTRYTAWHLRIRRLVQFIFAETVRNNALTNRAALLSPRGPSLALRAIHLVPHPA